MSKERLEERKTEKGRAREADQTEEERVRQGS